LRKRAENTFLARLTFHFGRALPLLCRTCLYACRKDALCANGGTLLAILRFAAALFFCLLYCPRFGSGHSVLAFCCLRGRLPSAWRVCRWRPSNGLPYGLTAAGRWWRLYRLRFKLLVPLDAVSFRFSWFGGRCALYRHPPNSCAGSWFMPLCAFVSLVLLMPICSVRWIRWFCALILRVPSAGMVPHAAPLFLYSARCIRGARAIWVLDWRFAAHCFFRLAQNLSYTIICWDIMLPAAA